MIIVQIMLAIQAPPLVLICIYPKFRWRVNMKYQSLKKSKKAPCKLTEFQLGASVVELSLSITMIQTLDTMVLCLYTCGSTLNFFVRFELYAI